MSQPSAPVQAIDALPEERREVLLWQVLGEVRWSFTRPMTWLVGVGVNMVLAAAWWTVLPLTGRHRSDWVIVVGTYFATFVLADVTTTNVLGLDALRVRVSLVRGVELRRILAVKNLALLVIVALPTLLVVALLTVTSGDPYRLVLTLPGVAFPILTWLGVGNVVSVLLPVAVTPVRERWEHRRDLLPTARWLFHLVLPYALLYAVNPVSHIPGAVFRNWPTLPRTPEYRGLVLALTGLCLWLLGTVTALLIVRMRGVRIR
ncbi:MAG: hypothetical protein ABR604_02505 [Jatrophihabitantaceae bacterium]